MRIKISTSGIQPDGSVLLSRQTPENSLNWNGIEFFTGDKHPRCDWWVVLHSGGLQQSETTICDPSHLVFASMEPPDWGCPNNFYQQFSHLVSCDTNANHPNITALNIHTWWAGIEVKYNQGSHEFSKAPRHNYESFSKQKFLENKLNKASIITSNKKIFDGHKSRVRFIELIKKSKISEYVDVYGFEENPIQDKLEALAPYKYHICLENSVHPNYWTEKLADSYLGSCLPIYHGCPNVEDFFSEDSIIKIDINRPKQAIALIKECLETDLFSKRKSQISTARTLVLNKYNVFQQLSEICNQPASTHVTCTLHPSSNFQEGTQHHEVSRRQKAVQRIKRAPEKLSDWLANLYTK